VKYKTFKCFKLFFFFRDIFFSIENQRQKCIFAQGEKSGYMKRDRMWKIFFAVVVLANAGVIYLVMMGSAVTATEPEDEPEKLSLFAPHFFTAVKIPDTVTFAGELVPVNRFDVRESLDRELLVNSYFHSQTLRMIKLAPRYFSIIEPILEKKGVPDDFKYLAVAESSLNPRAVSSARAVGIWQFLAATAQEHGLEINNEVDERYHLEKSTVAACDYLLRSYRKYGNWSMVAAAYNGGMAGVERQMNRQKNNIYYDILFGEETGRYVYRIIALKLIMEDPKAYNFKVDENEKYPVVKTRDVEVSGRIENLADFAIEQNINYKLLKDFNPWLREYSLANATRKKYTIKIPVLD
jgi:membrane-bound lytic murein transglycosylase D